MAAAEVRRGHTCPGVLAQGGPRCLQTLTPQSHEDGKYHGALVVEEVGELGKGHMELGWLSPHLVTPQEGHPSLQGQDKPAGLAWTPGVANLGKGAGVGEALVPVAGTTWAHVDVLGLTDLLAGGSQALCSSLPPRPTLS